MDECACVATLIYIVSSRAQFQIVSMLFRKTLNAQHIPCCVQPSRLSIFKLYLCYVDEFPVQFSFVRKKHFHCARHIRQIPRFFSDPKYALGRLVRTEPQDKLQWQLGSFRPYRWWKKCQCFFFPCSFSRFLRFFCSTANEYLHHKQAIFLWHKNGFRYLLLWSHSRACSVFYQKIWRRILVWFCDKEHN